MSQLSHEERKFFYQELLKMVCRDPATHYGFCWYVPALSEKLGGKYKRRYNYWTFTIDLIGMEYPELFSMRPTDPRKLHGGYWFMTSPAGWKTRINKLHNIIQSM